MDECYKTSLELENNRYSGHTLTHVEETREENQRLH